METINISSKIQNYKIILHDNVLDLIKNELDSKNRYFFIIDDEISSKYVEKIKYLLPHFFFLEIKGGEFAKSLKNYKKIINFLSKRNASKFDYLVAFGGGSISDLVGFVASTYKRGTNFIIIPTTVLCMVDASVGGKNAIDIRRLKNTIGTIYPPEKVLLGLDTLETLPEREFNNGLFEAIKTGIVLDKNLYEEFKNEQFDIKTIIYRSILAKKSVVETDEFDEDYRKVLNFGHTFGHAIETVTNFDLKHGEAVANGMLINLYNSPLYNDLLNILVKLKCPIIKSIDKASLLSAIKNDKKANGHFVDFVFVDEIGKGYIKRTNFKKLKGILDNYGI